MFWVFSSVIRAAACFLCVLIKSYLVPWSIWFTFLSGRCWSFGLLVYVVRSFLYMWRVVYRQWGLPLCGGSSSRWISSSFIWKGLGPCTRCRFLWSSPWLYFRCFSKVKPWTAVDRKSTTEHQVYLLFRRTATVDSSSDSNLGWFRYSAGDDVVSDIQVREVPGRKRYLHVWVISVHDNADRVSCILDQLFTLVDARDATTVSFCLSDEAEGQEPGDDEDDVEKYGIWVTYVVVVNAVRQY